MFSRILLLLVLCVYRVNALDRYIKVDSNTTIFTGYDIVDECKNLYFCRQAYVTSSNIVVARAYVTVSAVDSDASSVDEFNYVQSIGVESVVSAFKQAITISDWKGNFPCAVTSSNWNHMTATSQAIGLSQEGCVQFSALMLNTILSKQNWAAQVEAMPGWEIALIVLACIFGILICCCWIFIKTNHVGRY
ncbi:MAG: hypothetical protein PHG66_00400 [Candidatus Colwellbacteria bacterium]|nr:hypothetical protein [Candidatus Colwellbacteria bacterium]